MTYTNGARTQTRHESMVAAAVMLAEVGFAHIGWADQADGKAPTRAWKSDTTDDPAIVPKLLHGARNALIIPKGNGVITDVDQVAAWVELDDAGLPPTLIIDSPTTGHGHVYGWASPDVDMATIPGTFSGGEIRRHDPKTGTASMVLGPWALRTDGIYTPRGVVRTIAELPISVTDYLIASQRRQDAERSRARGPSDQGWKIASGRHDWLKSKARWLRGNGLSVGLFEELLRLDHDRCDPPLASVPGRGVEEIRRIAEWIDANIEDDQPEPEVGPSKPTVFDEDKRFVPAWAGAALRTEGNVLHGSDDRLWRWSAGVYTPDAEQWVAARLRRIIGKSYRDNHRRESVAWLNTWMPVEIGLGDPEIINLANGRLHWRTGVLREHSPDLITTVKLPVRWEPDAVCPRIDAFLDDVLDPTLRELVEEIAGLLLIPDQSFRKAVLLLGDGLNGKSTLLHVFEAMLGRSGWSSVSLRELDDDRFKAADLFGKLANICGDVDYQQSRASSIFKKIVGGDAISAERKFGQPFSFFPQARLIFSANQAPTSSDTSPAWFDRWLVVPMTRRIDEDMIDRGLKERLTTPGELSGFLVRAVAGLRRLAERGRFDEPELARAALAEYRAATEPVHGFLDEQCVIDDVSKVSRNTLYEAFSKWCEHHGHRRVLSQKEFTKRLRDQVPTLDETALRGDRTWIGVGLATTEERADARN